MIQAIIWAALMAEISPQALLAICYVETGLRNVININDGGSASYGVCQVKLSTARFVMPGIKVSELLNPQINAYIAALYYKYQLKRYKNYIYATAAYNAGSLKLTNDGKIVNLKYIEKVKYARERKHYYYQQRRISQDQADCLQSFIQR